MTGLRVMSIRLVVPISSGLTSNAKIVRKIFHSFWVRNILIFDKRRNGNRDQKLTQVIEPIIEFHFFVTVI